MSANDVPSGLGPPVLQAKIRVEPEDFQVDEVLGFEPDGSGEHVFLRIEKRGANTAWVASQLARWAGVRELAIGYAGLKDRHAVTRQTFSVHLPGRDVDAEFPHSDEFRLLERSRHSRKLQRGALKANRFTLLLREVQGDQLAIEQRLQAIARRGVPNYFGEQRFGRDGDNLRKARALFAGKRMRRDQASILLSAVRSAGFNAILAARVEQQCWDQAVAGDVFMLEGSRSVFGPQAIDDEIIARCADGDIHPTAALWGSGDPRSEEQARAFDQQHGLDEDLIQGLERAGLRQERRALRLPVTELSWHWPQTGQMQLQFSLPAGAYATSVLHELGLTESAQRAIPCNTSPGDSA